MQAQPAREPASKEAAPTRQLLRPASFQGHRRAAGADMPRRLSVPALPSHRTALARPQQASSPTDGSIPLPGQMPSGRVELVPIPEPSLGSEGDDLTAVSSSVTMTEGDQEDEQLAAPHADAPAAVSSPSSTSCWRRVPANPEVRVWLNSCCGCMIIKVQMQTFLADIPHGASSQQC